MPVIKSAKKKLRQDKKREKSNDLLRKNLAQAVKIAKKQKTSEKIRLAVKIADKASKKGVIHKNKASRIKSALSKLNPSKSPKAKKSSKSEVKVKTQKKQK